MHIISYPSMCIGNTKAKVTINVPKTISSGQTTIRSCVASGRIYLQHHKMDKRCYIRATVMNHKNAGHCSIKPIGGYQNLTKLDYQQDFNINCTCNSDHKMIGIKCFSCVNEIAQMLVQGMYLYVLYIDKMIICILHF